jgi:hypothetical protein
MAGKRPSAKAIGLLIAVFVLGGVVGSLGTYLAGHMHEQSRRHHIVDRLNRQLQLTPSQLKQVRQIFAEGHKRWLAIYRKSQDDARPQYEALHADMRKSIRAILSPAQQPKFDEFLKQLDAEHKAREKRQNRRH